MHNKIIIHIHHVYESNYQAYTPQTFQLSFEEHL